MLMVLVTLSLLNMDIFFSSTFKQTDRHLKNSINHSKIPFFGFIHSNIKCFGLIIVCGRHIKMHFEHFGKKKCQTFTTLKDLSGWKQFSFLS